MDQPTGTTTPPQPPQLLHYRTWVDEYGLHARLCQELPVGAIVYGCEQEIHADTVLELMQEAARNRVKVWSWESRR
ncbi:hypothetical protein [Nonomuraea angiospora]